MRQKTFEKRLLGYVRENSRKPITAAGVAVYARVSVSEAHQHLQKMLSHGAIAPTEAGLDEYQLPGQSTLSEVAPRRRWYTGLEGEFVFGMIVTGLVVGVPISFGLYRLFERLWLQ